jgi:hypothetical protein
MCKLTIDDLNKWIVPDRKLVPAKVKKIIANYGVSYRKRNGIYFIYKNDLCVTDYCNCDCAIYNMLKLCLADGIARHDVSESQLLRELG